MKSRWTITIAIATFVAAAVYRGPETACGQAAPRAAVGPKVAGVEAQSLGLVHEGFDQPIAADFAPGLIAPKEPPAPLAERLPALMPSGARVLWLPGYWGRDDARKDFIWVSGAWRVPPPGQRWLPGYWSKAEGGFQWTPGFWIAAAAQQIHYSAAPPKSQEAGPETPAPSPNHFYLPGYWVARGGDFAWQAGYWAQGKRGWVWTPARYSWTPAGAVFVAGYWDYPLTSRGQLQSQASALPLAPTDTSARNRAAQFAKHLHDLAGQRRQMETASPTPSDADQAPPAQSLRLPKLPAALAGGAGAVRPASAAAADSLPGIGGQRVPGASGRSVPGLGGRVVPGVRDALPGIELQKPEE